MNHYRAICAALFCALISVPAGATPFPSLSMDVGVCDPNNPANCVKPDASGNMPVTGTFSASLGGFTPSASGARGTPLSVTVADSSGTLPTGAVVAVTNVGTNPMYCNVNGIAATTSDQYISSAGGWFAFTIPATITTLRCIATGGSTTANTVGGSGLPTGTGGGGGSGGGGAVTLASGAVASGAYSAGSYAAGAVVAGAFLDGWDATQGAKADAAWVSGAGSVISLLKNIAAGVAGVIPDCGATPCTNKIGVVGVNTWAAGTLGAMANYGTSPGAVLVPGVNASLFYGTTAAVADPCQTATKVYTPVNVVTATNVIIAGVSAKKKYICSILLYPGGTLNFAVYQATTSTSCATAQTDIFGGHTTGTGFIATATAGFAAGSGLASIAATTTVNTDICITTSTTQQLSGVVVTVDQ
jgi:hypothetical protein